MKLLTVAPYFLVATAIACFGCCPLQFGSRAPVGGNAATGLASASPVADDDGKAECALCAGLGIDVSTDAAVVELGFVADGLLSNGLGAEANLDFGQGSGEDSGGYDPGDYLGKTAGYGSDYKVLWARLHARYPVPLGDNPDLKFVPIAGIGYYRWTESDCQDDFDLGICDPYTTTTLDVGGEVVWKQFGVKLILPIGDGPDLSMRVRYHLPVGR